MILAASVFEISCGISDTQKTEVKTLRVCVGIISWYVVPRTKAPSTPATLSKQRSTSSKQHSTLLPQTAPMSNEFIVKFRPFDKVKTNWTCSICFDFVERIVRLVAFNNVASTLLLVWTELNCYWCEITDKGEANSLYYYSIDNILKRS